MGGLWDRPGIPHKGWKCVSVDDVRGDKRAEDTSYAECEMCGQHHVRFVHCMSHPSFEGVLAVGCTCAEKMSDDYTTPKKLETHLRNRSARRANWLSRTWLRTSKGGLKLAYERGLILVFRHQTGEFGAKVGEDWVPGRAKTEREAQFMAFDFQWPAKVDTRRKA